MMRGCLAGGMAWGLISWLLALQLLVCSWHAGRG